MSVYSTPGSFLTGFSVLSLNVPYCLKIILVLGVGGSCLPRFPIVLKYQSKLYHANTFLALSCLFSGNINLKISYFLWFQAVLAIYSCIFSNFEVLGNELNFHCKYSKIQKLKYKKYAGNIFFNSVLFYFPKLLS